jgi:hypothetical protein
LSTQVLKDCAWGREASITVQRGGAATPTKNKWKKGGIKEQDQQQQQPPVSPRKPPVGAGLFRSKTPTADLYRFVPKNYTLLLLLLMAVIYRHIVTLDCRLILLQFSSFY